MNPDSPLIFIQVFIKLGTFHVYSVNLNTFLGYSPSWNFVYGAYSIQRCRESLLHAWLIIFWDPSYVSLLNSGCLFKPTPGERHEWPSAHQREACTSWLWASSAFSFVAVSLGWGSSFLLQFPSPHSSPGFPLQLNSKTSPEVIDPLQQEHGSVSFGSLGVWDELNWSWVCV